LFDDSNSLLTLVLHETNAVATCVWTLYGGLILLLTWAAVGRSLRTYPEKDDGSRHPSRQPRTCAIDALRKGR